MPANTQAKRKMKALGGKMQGQAPTTRKMPAADDAAHPHGAAVNQAQAAHKLGR